MEDLSFKSSCLIERIGQIVEITEKYAYIVIHNKRIEAALTKVAEDVILGDFVVWNGSKWIRKQVV